MSLRPVSPLVDGSELPRFRGGHLTPVRAVEVQDRSAPHGPESLAESAETAARLPEVAKTGLETTLQLVQSQCSTKAPPLLPPTAQTFLDEIATTPLRPVLSTVAVGVETTLQLAPFQCSVNDSPVSGLSGPVLLPMAHTSLLAAAAAPRNWAFGGFTPPLGTAGVETTLQLLPLKCSASAHGLSTLFYLPPIRMSSTRRR